MAKKISDLDVGVLAPGDLMEFERPSPNASFKVDMGTQLASIAPSMPQGRLTLTSGVAVTTSDVTGATAHFYTPAGLGNYAPCIVGSLLTMRTFAEMTQATTDATKSPAAVAASKVYDILGWDDAGTYRVTRSAAWASDTDRGTGAGTAEVDFTTPFPTNKFAVTNGPAAGKGIVYGSVRSNASSQLVDSEAFRWVSNIYNAVPRPMRVIEATDQWDYTTAAFRQANGSAANQLDFLQSLSGGMLQADVLAMAANTNSGVLLSAGIGIDSVTVPSGLIGGVNTNVATLNTILNASYRGYPGIGRHYAAWLERSNATPTTTWYGDLGVTFVQSGITGWINN